jgi:hypothetical protein
MDINGQFHAPAAVVGDIRTTLKYILGRCAVRIRDGWN